MLAESSQHRVHSSSLLSPVFRCVPHLTPRHLPLCRFQHLLILSLSSQISRCPLCVLCFFGAVPSIDRALLQNRIIGQGQGRRSQYFFSLGPLPCLTFVLCPSLRSLSYSTFLFLYTPLSPLCSCPSHRFCLSTLSPLRGGDIGSDGVVARVPIPICVHPSSASFSLLYPFTSPPPHADT